MLCLPMTEPTSGCTCSRQIVVSQTTAAARRAGRPRRASRGKRRRCLAVLLSSQASRPDWPRERPWHGSQPVQAARAVREPETPSLADTHKVPLPDTIDTVTLWRAQRARWPVLFFSGLATDSVLSGMSFPSSSMSPLPTQLQEPAPGGEPPAPGPAASPDGGGYAMPLWLRFP